MGALDSGMANLAQNLVCAFGTSVKVEAVLNVGYDPATRSASVVPAPETVNGVLESYNDSEIGDTVKRTDYKLHLAALDVTKPPKNGDHVVVNGNTMRVVSVRTEWAGGTAALYTCQVRG